MAGEGRTYYFPFNWLVGRYAKTADPDEPIRIATNAGLNRDNFRKSLGTISEMYIAAGFNDRVKLGMLHREVMERFRLSGFLVLKGHRDYQSLKEADIQYV